MKDKNMKKLAESERLERGVQILLSARDKEDLAKMARAEGTSLASATRPHILRALERWRKQNPELATEPLPEKPKTLTLDGKAVRTQRSLEAQLKVAASNGSNGSSNGHTQNGHTKNGLSSSGAALNGKASKAPARSRTTAKK
jgi:hypothetical protein